MDQVATLDRRGHGHVDIAIRVGISRPMVAYYLAKIRKGYQESVKINIAESTREKMAQLREIRAEAWDAWERSKEEGYISTEERELILDHKRLKDENGQFVAGPAKLALVKQILQRERSLPGDRYLSLVLQCLKEEIKLEGLVAPEQHNTNIFNLDWSRMHGRPADDAPAIIDPVEAAVNAPVQTVVVRPESADPAS